ASSSGGESIVMAALRDTGGATRGSAISMLVVPTSLPVAFVNLPPHPVIAAAMPSATTVAMNRDKQASEHMSDTGYHMCGTLHSRNMIKKRS
uniref:hypothetical protein n=1 Tax=Sphingomonas bacterium TaxID=1895847 RepID=UPI00260ECBBE